MNFLFATTISSCTFSPQVWTSELVRTHQTTQYIRAQKIAQPQLNEIDSGDFDGMTYEDVAEQHPIEFADRDKDKLRYRYPNGESYVDVCRSVLPVDKSKAMKLFSVEKIAMEAVFFPNLLFMPHVLL